MKAKVATDIVNKAVFLIETETVVSIRLLFMKLFEIEEKENKEED